METVWSVGLQYERAVSLSAGTWSVVARREGVTIIISPFPVVIWQSPQRMSGYVIHVTSEGSAWSTLSKVRVDRC